MLNQEILSYIEAHSQEAYELLLTLARIPAPSNHEEKRAEFCREMCIRDRYHIDEFPESRLIYPE